MKLYVTKKSAGIQYIVEENDAPVCRMDAQSRVAPEHIVHCVNNHDALVEALVSVIDTFGDGCDFDMDTGRAYCGRFWEGKPCEVCDANLLLWSLETKEQDA